jgi:hypothetical protein
MALALAQQIGGEVHHIPSRQCDLETVERITASCHYAPMFGQSPWHVILCDEADQMSRPAELAFLSKLDTTAAPLNTIFLFTANATNLLEDRFLSRCRVVKFSHEGLLGPACALLATIWQTEAPDVRAPDFAGIVKAAEYNIRQAIMNLELELIAPTRATVTPVASERVKRCEPIDIDTRTRAIALRRQHVPLAAIARQLNAPQSSVWRWTREASRVAV